MSHANKVKSDIKVSHHDIPLDHDLKRLAWRMISPFTGIVNRIIMSMPDELFPNMYQASAKIANIHYLQNIPEEPSYHIGGYGILLREAMYRVLAESLERYTHMVYPLFIQDQIAYSTYTDISSRAHAVDPKTLLWFSDEQYEQYGFPYHKYHESNIIGWVRCVSLMNGESIYVPAQCLLVGYTPRLDLGEPWMMSAVTTGSAAHLLPPRALLSALLELIEVDATMISWYTMKRLPILNIEHSPLNKIFEKKFKKNKLEFIFLYASVDLKPHVVITLIINKVADVPAVVAGAAADLNPERAVYRSLLEASAILSLAMFGYIKHIPLSLGLEEIDVSKITDLDRNVAYYSDPRNKDKISFLVAQDNVIDIESLENYSKGDFEDDIRFILGDLKTYKNEVFALDITTPDVKELGFIVLKLFSPTLVQLCIPSYPFKEHPRIKKYGGVINKYPHPFP